MGDPAIDNKTPLVFQPLFLADEELRPLLVPLVKATFVLSPGGLPAFAETQDSLCLGGERWPGADVASYRYEPEGAFFKPATDVVLVGHAHAQGPKTRELRVGIKVGPLEKAALVLGDRTWFKSLGRIGMTEPLPFERMPLRYERAYGGWDRSHPDPKRHGYEPRNPLGTGFRTKDSRFEEGLRLPNLEDPTRRLQGWQDQPLPVGFGFLSPDWQPRASLGGTYDDDWEKTRKPYLPRDFDRRFLSAASPGLVSRGYLRGDEPVAILNASPGGVLVFTLPGLPPPRVRVARRHQQDTVVELRLDTVILDTDAMRLFLLWRGELRLRREPTEVTSLELLAEGFERLARAG